MKIIIRSSFIGLLLFLFTNVATGQAIELDWAATVNGYGEQNITSVSTDNSGNVITVGYFMNGVDFNPSPAINTLHASNTLDAFVQKLDDDGNFLWAKNIGGSAHVYAYAIDTDSLGNIYITGTFNGSTDFDPGSGIVNKIPVGQLDAFVLKLNPNGDFLWVRTVGAASHDIGSSISVDLAGNVVVTGRFSNSIDFDPGPAFAVLTAINQDDVFIWKLDTNGDFLWAKKVGGNYTDLPKFVHIDASGNVLVTGIFAGTVDFDPGPGNLYLTAPPGYDFFVLKLDANGNFLWAKGLGGTGSDYGNSICSDQEGNVYVTGFFEGAVDFDPGPATMTINSLGQNDIFALKLDLNGNFLWAKGFGGYSEHERGDAILCDKKGNVYITGSFGDFSYFAYGTGLHNLNSTGDKDVFVLRLTPNGDIVWLTGFGGTDEDRGKAMDIDTLGNLIIAGTFKEDISLSFDQDTVEFPNEGYFDGFVMKISQNRLWGSVFFDYNQNCIQDTSDHGLSNRRLIIQPGDIIVETNSHGNWKIDTLLAGSYSITCDTSGDWAPSCATSKPFTILNSDSITIVPCFGMYNTSPCVRSSVSIHAPFLRPGFSNQKVFVQACNENLSTDIMNNPYVIVELNSLLTIQSASRPYTSLGNNQYRVNLDALYPTQCTTIWFNCHLSTQAVLDQSLCMKAEVYPLDSCSLDSSPTPSPPGITPCTTSYDGSFLSISANCTNDTICFLIPNVGDGGMSCFSQVRLFIDGQLVLLDSIQLATGDTSKFIFPGDGRTWRLEVDQHPLLYGSSQPSVTIEACGNLSNWTPDLFNILPLDDQNPNTDIFCGLVTGSYDPNDKRGFPMGIGATKDILPNQDLEYIIRFQNTGTDTAFTIVIRDTLSTDFNIFSVASGVSSNDYDFRIYGPRVLEWTFNHIMLPDSNVNEPASHGFVKFKVEQNSNVPIGTLIENSAAIYFDFNLPIFTNVAQHTIAIPQDLNWDGQQTITNSLCDSLLLNGISYTQSGTYWQAFHTNGLDSLYTIDLTILSDHTSILVSSCDSFIHNNESYTSSGLYKQHFINSSGCDSTITIDLTIDSLNDYSISQNETDLIANSVGTSYQWLDCTNGYSPIDGAIQQSFAPTLHGSYAVQVSRGNCDYILDCVDFMTRNVPNKLGIQLYPNPVSETLFINKGQIGDVTVNIYDDIGRMVYTRTIKDSIVEIDTNPWTAGLYCVMIDDGQNCFTEKIVKR